MTEHQKQALIEYCEDVISAHVQHGGNSDEEQVFRIALAALTAKPVACKKRLVNHRSGVAHHWTYHGEVDKPSSGDIFRVEVVPLYEHSAPAINLAELVPDYIEIEQVRGILDPTANPDEYACCVGMDMWNNCCTAMLRNIEEKSK